VDYRIVDAEERHREAPRSFFIPSREERESLEPGGLAQLLFEVVQPARGEPSAERMWVEVRARDRSGYVGVLTNVPATITTIASGDQVHFRPEHVIKVIEDWPLLEQKVFVSRRCHDDDVRPGFVYRENPDNDSDSGWRALVGDETDAEVDDPSNILLQAVGFLLDRWPELRPVLETDPANGEWRWDERAGRYVRIADG
jgi:hypothetical protein